MHIECVMLVLSPGAITRSHSGGKKGPEFSNVPPGVEAPDAGADRESGTGRGPALMTVKAA